MTLNRLFDEVEVTYTLMFQYLANLQVNAIVRLPHPRSRDSQGQEMLLAPSADKQLWHRVHKPPSLSINPKVKGIEP